MISLSVCRSHSWIQNVLVLVSEVKIRISIISLNESLRHINKLFLKLVSVI